MTSNEVILIESMMNLDCLIAALINLGTNMYLQLDVIEGYVMLHSQDQHGCPLPDHTFFLLDRGLPEIENIILQHIDATNQVLDAYNQSKQK